MKLIIAGSRGINNIVTLYCALEIFELSSEMIDEIVSGMARGADRLGEEFAKTHGIPVKQFLARWTEFGKSAGYKRNAEMAEYGTHLLALWDGESKGTSHMVNLMRKKEKPVYLYNMAELKK